MLKNIVNNILYIVLLLLIYQLLENITLLKQLIVWIIMTIIFILYVRTKKIENYHIGLFILIQLYIVMYYSFRLTVPLIKNEIKTLCNIGDVEYSQFTSIFSIFYGGLQVIGGYLLGMGGIRIIGLFSLLLGISSIMMSFQTKFTLLLLFRALLGFFSSMSTTGLAFYLGSYWPKSFIAILITLGTSIGLKGGEYAKLLCKSFNFQYVLILLGVFSIVIGILILILGMKLPDNHDNNTDKNLPENKLSISEIYKDKFIILILLYTIFSAPILYICQDGWINIAEYSILGSANNILFQTMSNTSVFIVMIFPFLINIFGVLRLILMTSILQLISFILLFYIPTNIFGDYVILISKISIMFITMSGFTHTIPKLVVASRYNKLKLGTYLGLLNFGGMFIGCSLSQLSFGYIGKILYPGTKDFSPHEVLNIFKIFTFSPLITFIVAMILYIKYKNE